MHEVNLGIGMRSVGSTVKLVWALNHPIDVDDIAELQASDTNPRSGVQYNGAIMMSREIGWVEEATRISVAWMHWLYINDRLPKLT